MQMIQLILSVQLIGPMGTFGNGRYGKNIGANVTIGVGCMLVQLVQKLHWRYNWHWLCSIAMVQLVKLVVQHWLQNWYNWLCSIGTIGTRIAGRQEAIGPGPTFWLQRQPPLHQ